MKYLSIEEVVAIHYQVVSVYGGSQGVRDFGLLHSAVERPKASFGGKDLYDSVYDKAAALLYSLVMNHPFVDGNKRTGYVSVARYLAINGVMLSSEKDTLISFVLKLEKEKLSIAEIATWLQKNSKD